MASPKKIRGFLQRLTDLERGDGPLAAALTASERRFEIARLRLIIPASVLAGRERTLRRSGGVRRPKGNAAQ